MYTKEGSQQTFKIPNNNLDVRFEQAYTNHNNKIEDTKVEQDKSQEDQCMFLNLLKHNVSLLFDMQHILILYHYHGKQQYCNTIGLIHVV